MHFEEAPCSIQNIASQPTNKQSWCIALPAASPHHHRRPCSTCFLLLALFCSFCRHNLFLSYHAGAQWQRVLSSILHLAVWSAQPSLVLSFIVFPECVLFFSSCPCCGAPWTWLHLAAHGQSGMRKGTMVALTLALYHFNRLNVTFGICRHIRVRGHTITACSLSSRCSC